MQYMHFNSSCAFCCVANLLELQEIKCTDEELFRNMKADLLLYYETESGEWQTGAMLQSGVWFDLALQPLGFSLKEAYDLSPEAVIEEEPSFMVGLKTEGRRGRHAHILIERNGDRMTFLNPHRENDGEADFVELTREECMEWLAPASTVGRLISCTPRETDFAPLLTQSKGNWYRYREELTAFASQRHTCGEHRAAMAPLFRALFLDGLEGAKVCGYRGQEERLRKLQGQFLGAIKQGKDLCLMDYLEEAQLTAALDFYCEELDRVLGMGKSS